MRNRMIVRTLAALAAGVLLLALTACGGKGTDGNDSTDTEPTNTAQPTQRGADSEEMPLYMKGFYELKAGGAAPDFTVELVDANGLTGETLSLSDLAGKIVILDFWATWCRYCVADMPTWQQIVTEYGDDVVFVAVNAGGESFGDMKRFIRQYGYDFTWAITNADVGEAYPFVGIPYDVVIDGSGQIVFIAEGSYGDNTYHVMTNVLNQALAAAA